MIAAVERGASGQPPANPATLLSLIALALDPYVFVTRPMPGNDATSQNSWGFVELRLLRQIAGLWDRALAVIAPLSDGPWDRLLNALNNWAFPAKGNVTADDEDFAELRATAARMMSDLARLPNTSRPFRHWIACRSRDARLDVPVELEDDFAVLFNDRPPDEPYADGVRRRVEQLDELAARLTARGRVQAAAWLDAVEREVAAFAAMHGGWDRSRLYETLASRVDRPEAWMTELASRQVPARFVGPFAVAVRDREPATFDDAIRDLFERPDYRELATHLILTSEGVASELLDRAITELRPHGRDDQHRFPWAAIPATTMLRLLTHPEPGLRAAAALGEWNAQPDHRVRPQLIDPWSNAILDVDGYGGRCHRDLFQSDPSVAAAWLARRLQGVNRWFPHDQREAMNAAADSLTHDQRRTILGLIDHRDRYDDDIFDAIVARKVELFRDWYRACSDDLLKHYTLRRRPGEAWFERATVAMDEGLSVNDLCDMVGDWLHSWSGSLSAYYRSLVPLYEQVTRHADTRFHPIGRAGIRWAQQYAARGLGEDGDAGGSE